MAFNLQTPYGESAFHDLEYGEEVESDRMQKIGDEEIPYHKIPVTGFVYVSKESNEKAVVAAERELAEKKALAQKNFQPEVDALEEKVVEINLQQ